MRKTILASLFALLLVPGLAAAAVPAPAPAADNAACNPNLSVLGAVPLTPANGAAAAFPGLEGVVQVQGGCCTGKLNACQARCDCGVFEFNCDPATCQSSCICNIC